MKFLYPYFLFALLAISIPLIIHFFNFKRYKTVYFSNVNFLKKIKKDAKKKFQLKQIFILISRILVVGFLVITFCQPYIPLTHKTQQRASQAVAIYVDNSFSMRLEGEQGILFEQAKTNAVEIVNSYRPGTKFLLITNDFSPRHRNFFDKRQIISQLEELKVSPATVDYNRLNNYVRQKLLETGSNVDQTFYVLSDFQKNSFDISGFKNDTTRWTYLLPFSHGNTNNLYIDSCWFEMPGRKINQTEKLFVQVVNSSEDDYQNIPVRLKINDSLKAISTINIAAGEEQIVVLNFTNNSSGFQYGKVELDDYPLVYDNSYYIAYEVKKKVDVLGIFEDGDIAVTYFKALFADDEFVDYESALINNFQVSKIRNNQCVFLVNLKNISSGLCDELTQFTNNGGSLVVFPSDNADRNSYNSLFVKLQSNIITGKDTGEIRISSLNLRESIFQNVFKKNEVDADLPFVSNFFHFSKKNTIAQTVLMSLRNGESALCVHPVKKGKLYTFAFPADEQNRSFLKHLIFIPAVYNVAMNSIFDQPVSFPIGINNKIFIPRNYLASNAKKPIFSKQNSNEEYLPTEKLFGANMLQLDLGDYVQSAGFYELKDDERTILPIAFNYKRNESVPDFYSLKDIEKIFSEKGFKQYHILKDNKQKLKETLNDLNNGKQLWYYFLILAILFLFVEGLILRFWK